MQIDFLSLPQPLRAEDVRNGDATPGRARGAEAGEGKSPDHGGESEQRYQGTRSPTEPGNREQHGSTETTAGDDGYGP